MMSKLMLIGIAGMCLGVLPRNAKWSGIVVLDKQGVVVRVDWKAPAIDRLADTG